jgi:hypothetical protein
LSLTQRKKQNVRAEAMVFRKRTCYFVSSAR